MSYGDVIPASGEGRVTGILEGTLDLPFVSPGGSGSGAASSLVFTSIPAGFGVLAGGDTATNSANQVTDSFTVVAGVVTSDQFFATTGTSDPSNVLVLNSSPGECGTIGSYGCAPDLNELHAAFGVYGYNFNGLPGVTFTLVSTSGSVPEPSTWAMMLVGFVGLSLAAYRRTKTKATAPAAA